MIDWPHHSETFVCPEGPVEFHACARVPVPGDMQAVNRLLNGRCSEWLVMHRDGHHHSIPTITGTCQSYPQRNYTYLQLCWQYCHPEVRGAANSALWGSTFCENSSGTIMNCLNTVDMKYRTCVWLDIFIGLHVNVHFCLFYFCISGRHHLTISTQPLATTSFVFI